MNETVNLLVLNSLGVWLIEAAKKSKYLPWITTETEKVNKLASAIIAALAAGGMVFTSTHTGTLSQGAITITWTGITLANVVSFLYHSLAYYCGQKVIFKLTANGKAVPAKGA